MAKKGGQEPPKGEKPKKRAGSAFRPPAPADTASPKACAWCNGHTYETRPQAEADQDGVFDGDANIDCRRCGGTGVDPE